MAVYRQTYRRYQGALTAEWSRFWVLYRFARRAVFRSKALLAFYLISFVVPLVFLIGIYLVHNLDFLSGLGIRPRLSIDNDYFYTVLHVQNAFAFLFAAFAGPGLIAPDLANGGLTLYLARPLSRMSYLLGKMAVLFVLLSQMTWVPCLVLWIVQASLGGAAWRSANLWMPFAIVFGGVVWIVILSLIALAISAWLRWRIVAGAALLGLYFFGAGFAQAVNAILRTQRGYFLDLLQLMNFALSDLFRRTDTPPLSLTSIWLTLVGVAVFAYWLIMRKVRAFEVVK